MWTIRDFGFYAYAWTVETESQSGRHLSGKPWNGGQPCPPLRLNHPLGLCEGASFRTPPWMADYRDRYVPPSPSQSSLPLPLSALLPCAPAVVSIPNGRPWSHTHAHLQALFPLHQTNAQLASSRGYKSKLPLHRLFQPRVCHHSKHHQRLLVFKGRQFRLLQSQIHDHRPSCSPNFLSSWTLCLRLHTISSHTHITSSSHRLSPTSPSPHIDRGLLDTGLPLALLSRPSSHKQQQTVVAIFCRRLLDKILYNDRGQCCKFSSRSLSCPPPPHARPAPTSCLLLAITVPGP